MNTSRKTALSFSLARLALGVGMVFALQGCNLDTDPNPSADYSQKIRRTRLAVTPMGESFELDGCVVKPYRVTTSNTFPDFTLATAQCPTAEVMATAESCGKNCTSNTVKVTSKVADPLAENANDRRLNELRSEISRLSKEVDQIQAARQK